MASETVEDGGDMLRSSLPVAGLPLLERQAERAIAAGAQRVLVLVTMLPQAVMGAIDRINARGVEAVAVRSMAEIVARLAPEDRLLLVGDALHAAPGQYRALAAMTPPALIVAPDNQTTMGFERIDATARWAGLALLPYGMLVDHADMPVEWDIGSTLVRAAVQAGARRVACDHALFERGEIALVTNNKVAETIEARMVQNVRFEGGGMGQSFIFAPIARLLGPQLLNRGIATPALLGGAVACLVACLGLIGFNMPFAGGSTGLVAALLAALGRFQMNLQRRQSLDQRLSQLFDGLLFLLPLAAIMPVLLLSFAGLALTKLSALAIALTLAGLWLIARWLPPSESDTETPRNVGLLPDGEFYLLIATACAAVGIAPFALPVGLVVAVGGLLAWLKSALKPSEEPHK